MPDYLVKEATKNDIQRIIRKVDGATGFAVNSPDALAITPQQNQRRDDVRPESSLRYGKATASWTSGNTVTLTPVRSLTDSTATGEANVTCYIVSPTGGTPEGVEIATNDVLAYLPVSTTHGVLVNIAQGSAGGSDLPGTGSDYMIVQRFASAWVVDYMKAGP